MRKIPSDILAMGNIDPAGQFRGGTPASIREATLSLMEKCCKYPNFAISSGCDIPPMSSWDNIDAYFTRNNSFLVRLSFFNLNQLYFPARNINHTRLIKNSRRFCYLREFLIVSLSVGNLLPKLLEISKNLTFSRNAKARFLSRLGDI